MANYKKKNCTGGRRSSCHLCKPWKVRLLSRDHEGFESFSAHKRRISLKNDIREENL